MIRLFLPLVIFVIFTQVISLLIRRMSPLISARMSIAILVLGFCTIVPLLVHLSVAWVFGVPDFGSALHRVLLGDRTHSMDRNVIGLAALTFLFASTIRVARLLMHERRLRNHSGSGIVVVPDHGIFAYALPGSSPTVVLSEGLVRSLSQTELDVVVAHEMSHVSNRHDRLLLAGRVCAIFNPFLLMTIARLRISIERIADQAAVDRCGDRHQVARTIAKVALGHSDKHFALGIASYGTLERIEQLSNAVSIPRVSTQVLVAASLVGLLVLTFVQWHHVVVAIQAACGW